MCIIINTTDPTYIPISSPTTTKPYETTSVSNTNLVDTTSVSLPATSYNVPVTHDQSTTYVEQTTSMSISSSLVINTATPSKDNTTEAYENEGNN